MSSYIGRRKFLAALGGAAAAWPLAARAQQPAMPVIGFLRDTSLANSTHLVVAFRRGLKEAGSIEGQNVVIEYRSAEDQAHRLPVLVADLLHHQVAVIVGNTRSALAAKSATTTVPIVFVTGGDPVMQGFVPSLNRPGGNMTGVSFLLSASGTKRLELLRQLMPKAAAIAVLVAANFPQAESERRDVQAAAHAIGQQRARSGSKSVLSALAQNATSTRPSRPSLNRGLAHSSSAPMRFSTADAIWLSR
jgi:putative ABC transport system substrate-binding protein